MTWKWTDDRETRSKQATIKKRKKKEKKGKKGIYLDTIAAAG